MNYELYTQLPKPGKPIVGQLAGDKDALYLFQGERCVAVLHKPELVLANPDGLKFRGFEAHGYDKTGRAQYKYQEWFCRYQEAVG